MILVRRHFTTTPPPPHTHTHTHTHTVLGEVNAIKGINADFFARPPETSRTLSVSGRSWGGVVAGLTERERDDDKRGRRAMGGQREVRNGV